MGIPVKKLNKKGFNFHSILAVLHFWKIDGKVDGWYFDNHEHNMFARRQAMFPLAQIGSA